MRRLTLIFLILMMTIACKKEEAKASLPRNEMSSEKDDFSDLKAPTGGCKTEEDLKKKLEEEAKTKKTFKLQGNNTDCKVN